MGVKSLLKQLTLKRPPGPSFSELMTASEQSEAYAVLDYPASLSKRFGELIYLAAAKQYLVTGPVGFEHILKTNVANYTKLNIFYSRMRSLFGNSLLVTEGSYWKQRRQIAKPAFQPMMVKSYIPIITEECQRFSETLKADPSSKINLLYSMNLLTLKIALRSFCSREFSEKRLKKLGKFIHFVNWYTSHTLFIKPWKPTINNLKFYFCMNQINQFLLEIIKERRNNKTSPAEDLLAFLMSAKNESGSAYLTDTEILAEFKTLILTGHETTACGLTWMWYCLAKNPDYLALLEQELSDVLGGKAPSFLDLNRLPILKAIVSETFRLYPPIWAMVRKSIDPDVICGYSIPPKSLFALNIYALHRNPLYWENPNTFYPPRFFEDAPKRHPYAYLPFSLGPHTCIASHFAMTESLLVAAIIAQQVRFETLPKTKVVLEPCISLRQKGGLWMKTVLR